MLSNCFGLRSNCIGQCIISVGTCSRTNSLNEKLKIVFRRMYIKQLIL